ncbi:hypothetical protein [Rhizohabitans arisaemae]|uniref:hypothetical protein n=1 Tax=Rhizohabitans arisaemae TaxID=2720610 RepID=UPI0024B1A208|nr:hypothetical protein [Rhizohabitans arisaemae]
MVTQVEGRPIRMGALVVSILMTLTVGCGDGSRKSDQAVGPSAGVSKTNPSRVVDLAGLTSQSFLFTYYNSPEELVKGRDHVAIVIGEVTAINQGRDIYRTEESPTPQKYVVVHVKVAESFKDRGYVKDGYVYLEMYQGGLYSDGIPKRSLDDWRAALPAGTRLMLFLGRDYKTGRIEGAENGRPPGTELTIADPQGILVESTDLSRPGIADAWGEVKGSWKDITSLSEVGERVRKALQ